MEIRLIIYLDDMLIMAESRDLTLEHNTINQNVFVPPKGQVKEHQEGVSGYD